MITVKELIRKCERRNLCEEYIKQLDLPKDDHEKSIAFVSDFIEKLLTIEPVLSDNDVIINSNYIDSFSDNIETSTSVYYISEIKKYFKPVDFFDELEGLTLDELTDDVDRLAEKFIALMNKRSEYTIEKGSDSFPGWVRGFSYTMTDWNKVLGWLIPDFALETKEIVRYASQIIYELTFFGYEEQDMLEEKEKLNKSIREVKEIEKLSEEEKKKHYKSANELFDELGIIDERSDEEKQYDERKSYRCMTLNGLYQYRAIKRVYNEIIQEGDKNGTQ